MAISIRNDVRLAGEVIRYHTWPHIRQQSVAEHSWQLCRILMSIAPPRLWSQLLPYAVLHDVGEIVTGDAPYPIKANNPDLGDIMRRIESDASQSITRRWGLPHLSLDDQPVLKHIFKLAEFIEMWEWGLSEMLRGNEFARLVVERCGAQIAARLQAEMEDPSGDLAPTMTAAALYVAARSEEWGLHAD